MDNPPSYQEPVLSFKLSFAYVHPRIRAESFVHLLLYPFSIALSILLVLLQCFGSLTTPFFSNLQADHNFETIPKQDSISSHEYHEIPVNSQSYQDSVLTPELSFTFACPRIRAEFLLKLLLHSFSIMFCAIVAQLCCFHPLIVLFLSALHADHNFESIEFSSDFICGPTSIPALEKNFAYVRPRIKAESLSQFFLHPLSIAACVLLVILRHFYSIFASFPSEFHSDHNFKTIASCNPSSSSVVNSPFKGVHKLGFDSTER
jgi:hypothetical protein